MKKELSIKFRLLFPIFLLNCFSATSQQICGELLLFFEDAMGNRDTLTIKYGVGYQIDSVYIDLEEDSLSFESSFNNDLTVFASKGYYDSNSPFFSRTSVLGTSDLFC